MNIFIFTGPTLVDVDKNRELDAVYLPPAAAGDVYRASLERPQVIGIIDGYFQTRPAVRHKEILWAMTQGVHVFGSASMGALRAAELAPFGMEGVGKIFEWYRDGLVEDDDEVAIAHTAEEDGYRALSDAMVNIRATLDRAALAGAISADTATMVQGIAKDLFYPARTFPLILSRASNQVPADELDRLRQWLPTGRIDQKKEDAVQMLRLIRRRITAGLAPKAVSFPFQNSSMWEGAKRRAGELQIEPGGKATNLQLDQILDELRLEPNSYQGAKLLASERYFALRESHRMGITVTTEMRAETERNLRQAQNLTDASLKDWKRANHLSDAQFESFLNDEARLNRVRDRIWLRTVAFVKDHLRRDGTYSRLRERALAKTLLLVQSGFENATLQQVCITETELLRWYFTEIANQKMPENPDEYARNLDQPSREGFLRMLLREYLFRSLSARKPTGDSGFTVNLARQASGIVDRGAQDQTQDRGGVAPA